DVPGLVGAEDPLHLRDQIIDAITDPRMPELAKVCEIFTNLSIGQAETFAELFARYRSPVFAFEAFELAEVEAQSPHGGIGDKLRSGLIHAAPEKSAGQGSLQVTD